jgi:CheY-like chemotaxis protein
MELAGMRVLLVEDESLVAMLVEDMLADLGCTVAAHAGSLPDALEEARAGGFEVALLDVSLDGKKVFPVAEALSVQASHSRSQAEMAERGCRKPFALGRSCRSRSKLKNFRPH